MIATHSPLAELVATELAKRTGLLEGYNAAINRGAAGVSHSGPAIH